MVTGKEYGYKRAFRERPETTVKEFYQISESDLVWGKKEKNERH